MNKYVITILMIVFSLHSFADGKEQLLNKQILRLNKEIDRLNREINRLEGQSSCLAQSEHRESFLVDQYSIVVDKEDCSVYRLFDTELDGVHDAEIKTQEAFFISDEVESCEDYFYRRNVMSDSRVGRSMSIHKESLEFRKIRLADGRYFNLLVSEASFGVQLEAERIRDRDYRSGKNLDIIDYIYDNRPKPSDPY